ncbi:MAG: radical SAM protein [Candidatus Fermentibacteraceae bacterium]
MRYLILSPPVHQPSEPPSGAFLLSAALAARGIEAPFFDLSLEFFHSALEKSTINTAPALRYMTSPPGGLYEPHRHASHSGVIMSALKRYAGTFPGWHLTPMDCTPPRGLHRPGDYPASGTPFEDFYGEILEPVLNSRADSTVLVSVAYLSQLPGAVELGRFLRARGRKALFGGSLFESLSRTGTGLSLLKTFIPEVTLDDGSGLLPTNTGHVMDELVFPELLSKRDYLSPAHVLPVAFTTGCVWNKCLFCPDREKPLKAVPERTIRKLLEEAPRGVMVHFIDSTVPMSRLESALPLLEERGLRFFGFTRATREFLKPGLLDGMARSGCSMLQWGIESGSPGILERFGKGIDPKTALMVLKESAARGIRNYAYFLFGLPGETDRDREMTIELIEEAGTAIDFMNASVFNLPVDSELTGRHREFGMSLGTYDPGTDAIRLYSPFTCDGGDPRTEAKRFLWEAGRRSPVFSGLLSATPKWFRATHMAFMGPATVF